MVANSEGGERSLPGGVELRAGERVLYQGRPAWRALLTFYAGGLVLAVVVFVVLVPLLDVGAVGVLVALVIAAGTLLIGWLRRVSTRYLITDQRLRITTGIVRREVHETRLARVQNVNYQQSVLDRMLGVGHVDFDTAGTDDSEFQFSYVNGPEKVVRAVDQAIHADHRAQRDSL
ncbi:MAG TPA: PH domain-containing protein [Thermoleophilaceae bacterium]|nr:PH domain-containing protein [Thermoleophilaceae bacterium]